MLDTYTIKKAQQKFSAVVLSSCHSGTAPFFGALMSSVATACWAAARIMAL